MNSQLRGTGVALVTPFNHKLEIDYDAFKRLLKHVESGGVDYLVVMGSTGESATLSWDEKLDILSFVCENTQKSIVLGYGGNDTRQMIQNLSKITQFPISSLLIASPYYNKPSQKGLIEHYTLLADASNFPILLYNVPSRTGVNIDLDTTLVLAHHKNIVGIKEASGNLEFCREIVNQKLINFLLLSGDDQLALDIIKLGGDGVISVIANFLPGQYCEMIASALGNDFSTSEKINKLLSKSYELMSREGNPTSVKTALSLLGLSGREVRLPLTSGSDSLFDAINLEFSAIKKG